WKKHLNWATRISSNIGSGFGILLIILGVYAILTGNFVGGMWWVLIGFFIRGAAQASYQQLLMKKGLEGETVSSFMQPQPVTVTSDLPIDKLVHDYFYRYHHRMFPVVDDGELKGLVRSTDLRNIDREQWSERRVSDVMHPVNSSTIAAETDARQALAKMNQKDNTRLMVTDRSGHLTGIVTLRDLMQFLNYKLDLELDEDQTAKPK
ncbi:MAG: CBS domain-containing protein, partial [Chitinivibrionales bacterium]|nr:CBS domain-containing protein [Chitinivibrionales bacterium]